MRDAETFQSGIVTILTSHESKNSLSAKQPLTKQNVAVVRMVTYSSQEIIVHNIFHIAHSHGYNKRFLHSFINAMERLKMVFNMSTDVKLGKEVPGTFLAILRSLLQSLLMIKILFSKPMRQTRMCRSAHQRGTFSYGCYIACRRWH